MKISIKTRLIVGLLVTTSLILIAIFFVVAMNFSNQAITSSTSAAQSDLSQINNSISIFLDESKKSVNLLANYPLSKSLDEVKTTFVNSKQDQLSTIADDDGVGKKLVELFLAMQNSHPAFVDVYSASPNGGFILANQTTILPAGYDPRQRPWYKDALMYPDQTTIGEAYLSATGEAVTTISRSVLRNSTPVGVVAVDISLKKLTDLTGSIKLGQNGYVVLVQSDGIILADPHNEKNNFKNIKEIKSQALKDLFQMDSGSLEFEDETGAQWVGVVSTSEQTQWKIFGFISKSEIMAPVYKTLMNLVYIAIVSLVLIGVLIWLIASKAIIKPLSSVNIFLGRIREGDYAYREPHSRTDEIGAIIDSLNTMAEVLEGNITEIGHKTREAEHKALVAEEASQEAHEARCHAESAKNDGMMHAASTLEGIVGIVNSTSQELSAQIEDASQGALNQAELVSETATAMDEMTTTVLEVARNAAQASETAESAKTKAQEGANKVGEVLIGIEDVTKQSSLLKNDMGQLGDQAKDISRILTVISDIADQTNLLALNAALKRHALVRPAEDLPLLPMKSGSWQKRPWSPPKKSAMLFLPFSRAQKRISTTLTVASSLSVTRQNSLRIPVRLLMR